MGGRKLRFKDFKLFTFLLVFLIISITPSSATQLSDVQKDAESLSEYNVNKIKHMGFFAKLKLLHKLPTILAKAKKFKTPTDLETTDTKNPISEFEDATQTVEMLKTKNITVTINNTTEKVNSTYILQSGDIVQLKYEKQYIYLAFKEYTANGNVVLSHDGNEIRRFVSDFNNEFTGTRLVKPQRNNKTINSGYAADIICQNHSMGLEGELNKASAKSRSGRVYLGVAGFLFALGSASLGAAGILLTCDITRIAFILTLLIGLIFIIISIILGIIGISISGKSEKNEDKIRDKITCFEGYIKNDKGPFNSDKPVEIAGNQTPQNKTNNLNMAVGSLA